MQLYSILCLFTTKLICGKLLLIKDASRVAKGNIWLKTYIIGNYGNVSKYRITSFLLFFLVELRIYFDSPFHPKYYLSNENKNWILYTIQRGHIFAQSYWKLKLKLERICSQFTVSFSAINCYIVQMHDISYHLSNF